MFNFLWILSWISVISMLNFFDFWAEFLKFLCWISEISMINFCYFCLSVAASSSLDSHVRVWDVDTGKCIKSMEAGPGKIEIALYNWYISSQVLSLLGRFLWISIALTELAQVRCIVMVKLYHRRGGWPRWDNYIPTVHEECVIYVWFRQMNQCIKIQGFL